MLNLFIDVIKRINHTSATHATNASAMNKPCLNTYPSTKNRNTSKHIFANIVGNRTRRYESTIIA